MSLQNENCHGKKTKNIKDSQPSYLPDKALHVLPQKRMWRMQPDCSGCYPKKNKNFNILKTKGLKSGRQI
jgi:hypothetical protein